MIRFFFVLILILSVYFYIKYHEQHPYFYFNKINSKYNLVELNFLTLNRKQYIEKNSIILLEEDALELMMVFEDCYIDKMIFDFEGNKIFF